ncbi:unnamed protein product [Coffea canephora]|uniref:Major facilitator superfamily (MFS) profile domain-containing protein n=1 Tax=Coffea canephora TaxID=49390 RepID=A0A068UL18_COFCA|nr:unnamed protein product [Coffea canephora]
MACLTLSASGWVNNIILYLITEFNFKIIDAAKGFNVISGCMALFPILGAVIADSFIGCFSVIWISSIINLLGVLLFTLTASLGILRPKPCNGSGFCDSPSQFQHAILILAMAFGSIGVAGTRFTLGTMGAYQLDNPKHQEKFFNWFLFAWNSAAIVAATVVIYVQDDVSWAWGFGMCVAANVLGLIIFLAGWRFYCDIKPQGSPFKDLTCVILAAIAKRKLLLSDKTQDFYSETMVRSKEPVAAAPTESFKYDFPSLSQCFDLVKWINQEIICTVQQVEDLKTLIRIIPLWTTGIFLSTPVAIQSSLTVIQALTMDRHFGPNFKIPPASIMVFTLLSAISLPLIDRLSHPIWQKISIPPLTLLQKIGIGHVLTILSMAISALVESTRLRLSKAHNLHSTSTSTAMAAMLVGMAFYLSAAFIDLFRRVTNWLPDNINQGRLDNVYWMLVAYWWSEFRLLSCLYLVLQVQSARRGIVRQINIGLPNSMLNQLGLSLKQAFRFFIDLLSFN